jgi:hypothetical protein
MNNVIINVKNANGSIAGKIDIGEAELNLVYQIADVREPDKKQSSFSYPFTVPGTKNNNRIFQHIFENGFSSFQYNPNKKLDVQIILNGNQFFVGDLQLNAINKIDNKLVSYDITIYGKIPSFFDDISEFELKDLIDLSDYNHNYTKTNVVNSWSKSIIQNAIPVTFTLGRGYVYPMEYKGQNNPTYWKVEDFKPSIYVKTIFDKIIQSQGFTYQSDFLNSKYFRSLILPYNGDDEIELTDDGVKKLEVWAKYPEIPNEILLSSAGSLTGQTYLNSKLVFKDDNNTPAADFGNNYDIVSGIVKIPKNGKYKLVSTVALQALFTGKKIGSSTQYTQLQIFGGQLEGTLKIRNVTTGVSIASTNFTFTQGNINGNAQLTPVKSDIVNPSVSYTGYLSAGDKYAVYLDWRTTGSNYTYKTKGKNGLFWQQENTEIQIRVIAKAFNTSYNPFNAPRLILSLVEKNVSEGDMLDMNFFIPDIKAVDIVNEITKLFNLYWTITGEKSFRIEPRNEFYTPSNIIDWTYKLDNNETVNIQPLYDLTNKEYNFSYTEDGDYYNQDYFETYNEVFGSKNLEIDNDFVVDKLEIKSGFSPTPAVQYLATDRVMPSYVKKEGDVMKVFTPKIRILFYGGTFTTTTQWLFKNPYNGQISGSSTVPNPATGQTVQLPYTIYPYAGHINNPINPLWDLNWAVPKKIYYTWNSVTTNTLFNMFWRDHIEEVVDKNSHLLTATVILNDYDIINLDLRCLVQVDNVYYRINKITHNPLTGVAEVELFRAKDYPKRSGSSINSTYNANAGEGSGTFPKQWVTNYAYKEEVSQSLSSASGFQLTGDWRAPFINIEPFKITDKTLFKAVTPMTLVASQTGVQPLYKNQLWAKSGQSWGEVKPKASFYPMQNKDANGNFYSPQSAQKVLGQYNSVDPSAFAVEVKGSNNVVMDKVANIAITGNNNIISSGVQNVTVVGDNQVVTESNASYLAGVIYRDTGLQKRNSIIKSPTNSTGVDFCTIKGGKNAVKSLRVLKG